MARNESKAIIGFLKIDTKHHNAIALFMLPATVAHCLHCPFAGEGEFFDYVSNKLHYITCVNVNTVISGEHPNRTVGGII